MSLSLDLYHKMMKVNKTQLGCASVIGQIKQRYIYIYIYII